MDEEIEGMGAGRDGKSSTKLRTLESFDTTTIGSGLFVRKRKNKTNKKERLRKATGKKDRKKEKACECVYMYM